MRAISLVAVVGVFSFGAQAVAAPQTALEQRLAKVEAQLDAEQEARDRQADAFNAATDRIEWVSGAVVVLLTLAGIGVGLLGVRWVRSYTQDQVTTRVDQTMKETGASIFEEEARQLRQEYEEKFAELYRRYKGLVDRE